MTSNVCAFCGNPCEDNFCTVQCKLEFIGSEDNAPPMYMHEPYGDYVGDYGSEEYESQ